MIIYILQISTLQKLLTIQVNTTKKLFYYIYKYEVRGRLVSKYLHTKAFLP